MSIEKILNNQKKYFNQGITRNISFRKRQLQKLRDAIRQNETIIKEALKKDLNKSEFESYETEIGIVLEEIRFMLRHMDKLAKPRKVRTPITHFISSSKIYQEPYGTVLIISPWNYPFQLTMVPLVGAIATGNCAVVKPSNYSPHTSAVIKKIINEVFPQKYIAVIEGGREVNQSLLLHKFDYIFFTGSVSVGKLVMEQASMHLTPVTLELGGKSPCIIDETANIRLAAKRICWGKFLNAGQTCVAPDYILVHISVKDKLVKALKFYMKELYGDEPEQNEDYPKIINERHFNRISGLIDRGELIFGGAKNKETKQIAPAIFNPVTWDSEIMQEEIFGPILPILTYDRLEEVVKKVKSRPKSLALYYFTTSKKNEQYVINNISYGGGCINDTIVHLASSYLGFGGVGDSGMGSYHGEKSFHTFSYSKGVLKKSNIMDIPLRYPPFKNKLWLLKKIMN